MWWFRRKRPIVVKTGKYLPPIEKMSYQELAVTAVRQREHIAELNKHIDYLEKKVAEWQHNYSCVVSASQRPTIY